MPQPNPNNKLKRTDHNPWIGHSIQIGLLIVGAIYCGLEYLLWTNAQASHEVTNRAWIHVVPGFNPFPPSADLVQQLATALPVINSGKLPARDIAIKTNVDLFDRKDMPTLRFTPPYQTTTAGILFPTSREAIPAAKINSDRSQFVLTDAQRKALIAGDLYLVVYAEITYRDDFGEHWTRYCGWRSFAAGATSSRPCVLYNNVGDGTPPS